MMDIHVHLFTNSSMYVEFQFLSSQFSFCYKLKLLFVILLSGKTACLVARQKSSIILAKKWCIKGKRLPHSTLSVYKVWCCGKTLRFTETLLCFGLLLKVTTVSFTVQNAVRGEKHLIIIFYCLTNNSHYMKYFDCCCSELEGRTGRV